MKSPAEVAEDEFNARPEYERLAATKAGNWVIVQISEFAERNGFPISSGTRTNWTVSPHVAQTVGLFMVRTFAELDGEDPDEAEAREHQEYVACVNLAVGLIRATVEEAKRQGVESIKVRHGLVLPLIWQQAYEAIFNYGLPWFISVAMQNAFISNPLEGETGQWLSE